MNTETPPLGSSALAWTHPLVRDWFVSRFGTPTEPQQEGWPHILARKTCASPKYYPARMPLESATFKS